MPVINNNQEFKNRFTQLFGELQLSYLSYVQNLLQQFDLTNSSSRQVWYQDATAHRLVRVVFRNRVVNYIEANLDNPIQSNINNNQAESFSRAIQLSENEININSYLERMRQINEWGGQIEILAIGNILNSNINEHNTNTIQIFHVNNRTHYNFGLSNQENNEIKNTNSQEKTTINIKNQQKSTEAKQEKTNIIIQNKSTGSNNTNVPLVNKTINKNIKNLQTTTKNAINKYNSLSKEEKQEKTNEINQHYQNLSENDKKVFKNKLTVIGTSAIGAGISVVGTKITVNGSASTTIGSTAEAIEMTPLLSEGGLAAA